MSLSSTDTIDLAKRRLMLYKALQEFPTNDRIRKALTRTYASLHIKDASRDGVFISYNRHDELFALELDHVIRQAGVNVWLDQIDINPAEDWAHAIKKALNRSGVMVLVLSPSVMADDHLRQEAMTFMESGKIVIPVIHEPCNTEMFQFLVTPIDFSQNFEMGVQLLLASLTGSSVVND